MNLQQLIEFIKIDEYFSKNVKQEIVIPKREEKLVDFPEDLDQRIVSALKLRNIYKLYLHQYLAYDLIKQSKNVLLTTSTASGKTLAFLLPVLNQKLKKPNLRVLFIYPTKALSRDQENWIQSLCNDLGLKIGVYTYDGDTNQSIRKKIRESGDFIITNPDMLHSTILSQHTSWVQLFENLEYIIIDEVHIYKGIFGSHFTNVLRRLYRICKMHNSNPKMIAASATIGNPKELIEKLTEKEFEVIDQDYSKRSKKIYLFYSPRSIKKENHYIQPSILVETTKLAKLFLKNEISTIIFCKSRKEVELLTNYLKQNCPEYEHKIKSYRSGYLPNERKEIEIKLRNKEILMVVSTNALELGIDIGSLEVSISVGYPGSIHSFLQQSGRAGRKTELSLSILVASSDKMDQYIIKKPEFIFHNNPENVKINPNNLWIVSEHLKCALSEKPFFEYENFGTYPYPKGILDEFLKNKIALKRENLYYWCGESFPQNSFSIRSGPKQNFVILDITYPNQEKVIGEMDFFSAPLYLHPQAIYLHQTETYFVEELLWEKRIAKVKQIKTDYYTEAENKVFIKPLYEEKLLEKKEIIAYKGELSISTKPTIFKKIKFITNENIGWGEINLPEIEMRTQGFWILFETSFFQNVNVGVLLLSISYSISIIATVLSSCESNDIRCFPMIKDPIYEKYALYIYDNFPNGLEISYFIYNNFSIILEETIHNIQKCECEKGCPACIGLFYLEDKNQDYKNLTVQYINQLLSIFKEL